MSNYVIPRSVSRLEEELAELEKEATGQTQKVEEENEEEGEVEETSQPTSKEEETWKKRHGDLRRLTQKKDQELWWC